MSDIFSRYWRDIANVAGALFSLAGLVVSAFAAAFALRAKRSANEAAKAARHVAQTRTLHEYLTDCSRISSDISKYVDLDQRDMALHSARETLRLEVLLSARWEPGLSVDTKKRLASVRAQLDSIIAVLLKGPIADLGKGHKATLRVSAQRVTTLFTEELGNSIRIREGVEDYG